MMQLLPSDEDWQVLENALAMYGDQLAETVQAYEKERDANVPPEERGIDPATYEFAGAESGRAERLWRILQARRGWLPTGTTGVMQVPVVGATSAVRIPKTT